MVGGLLAGADSIEDLGHIASRRHDRFSAVWVHPPTMGTFLPL